MSAAVCCCEWNCGAIRRCSCCANVLGQLARHWDFRAGMPCRSSRVDEALTNISAMPTSETLNGHRGILPPDSCVGMAGP